jgi:short-subunit dehydrogenase
MSAPLCIVVGYGAGVGHGIALAFGKAGFRIGLIARDPARHTAALLQLADAGVQTTMRSAEIANEDSLVAAIREIAGPDPVDVLAYNAVASTYGPPSTLAPSQLAQDLRIDVVGALAAAQTVLPGMLSRHTGALLFTGGGWAHYPSQVERPSVSGRLHCATWCWSSLKN